MSEKQAKKVRQQHEIPVRQIKPGEYQNVKAMEEVTRRNVESAIQFGNDTRKMVLELSRMFDALQANVMNMKRDLDQTKNQLATLQQQFYARGTTSYADGDKGK